jgi:hypothetical protein
LTPVDRGKDNFHKTILHIDKIRPFDKITLYSLNKRDSPDKAKPFVRRGQKAAGLLKKKMAELTKDNSKVGHPFYLGIIEGGGEK